MGKLDDFADEHTRARLAENEEIARTARAHRARAVEATDKLTAALTEVERLQRELSLFDKDYTQQRPDWLMPKKTTPKAGTLIGLLSDIHTGEVVMPNEMGGFNKYNLAIAEMRLRNFFTKSIEMARSWSAYEYDGAVLPLLGDLTSGDIHDELVETNEMSTYEVVLWLVPRLSEGIEMWRKAFKRVHVASAPGNHGRDNIKPRYKKRSAHNADTLIAKLVAREFASVPEVTFEVPDSLDAFFKVYGFQFSLEHGEELARKFSGSAEIGALGPLMRGTNRTKVALAAQGKTLDYALWAHFHQLIPLPSRGFIANGSVKGYDEFAKGGKFKPEPPQQALMVCVPEYGIKTQDSILVGDRTAEGW